MNYIPKSVARELSQMRETETVSLQRPNNGLYQAKKTRSLLDYLKIFSARKTDKK